LKKKLLYVGDIYFYMYNSKTQTPYSDQQI